MKIGVDLRISGTELVLLCTRAILHPAHPWHGSKGLTSILTDVVLIKLARNPPLKSICCTTPN